MKEILDILNPVHLPKVEEWMKIAEISNGMKDNLTEEVAILFMKRFEQLTSQPLLKEMFVCGIEKPYPAKFEVYKEAYSEFVSLDEDAFSKAKLDYTEAQSKLWFDGEWIKEDSVLIRGGKCLITPKRDLVLHHSINDIKVHTPNSTSKIETVFDFIIEIDRYNRTAQQKIQINWTENFVKELLK